MKPCKFCGVETKNEVFCSRSCIGKWATQTPEGRAKFYTKERGKKISTAKSLWHQENPDQSQSVINRMRDLTPEEEAFRQLKAANALRAIGHKPPVRCGNGSGPTKAELLLLSWLPGSKNNHAIKTKMPAGSGYPTHYKIDVAIPELKFAVEADGMSHNLLARKEQDLRKTEFLRGLGWTVLRIPNRKILEVPDQVKSELQSVIERLRK